MNKLRLLLPILLLLVAFAPYSNATWTCPSTLTCFNLSITNPTANAIPAGTPIKIDLNTVTFNAYIGGTANLNFEVANFMSGANTIPYQVWDGNVNNYNQITTLNSVQDFVGWVSLSVAIPGSVTAYNAYTLGINAIGNSMVNGNNIGLSVILSNAISTCSKYDNSGNVYRTYNAFGCGEAANVIPAGWTNSVATGGISIVNYPTNTQILGLTATQGYNSIGFTAYYASNTIGNALDLIGIPAGGSSGTDPSFLQAGTSNTGSFIGGVAFSLSGNSGGNIQPEINGGTAIGSLGKWGNFQSVITAYTITLAGTANQIYQHNYSVSKQIVDNNAITNNPKFIQFITTNTVAPIVVSWFDTRAIPSLGIQPAIGFAVLPVSIAPSSTQNLDVGQTVTFTTYEAGGTSPITYNFLVFNSVTNVLIANQLGASNSFTVTANTFMVGNTYKANVIVTDSGGTSVNSILSGQINVNTALLPTLTLSNTLIDQGQTISFTGTTGGGTSPFTYNFLVTNTAWHPPTVYMDCVTFVANNACTGVTGNTIYDAGGANNGNGVYVNRIDIFNLNGNISTTTVNGANIPYETLDGSGLNGAQANSVISSFQANGFPVLIGYGGAHPNPGGFYGIIWNTIISNQITGNLFIGNVVNTLIGSSLGFGWQATNGVQLDVENTNPGDITFANYTNFIARLSNAMQVAKPGSQLTVVFAYYEVATSSPQALSINGMAPYVTSIDVTNFPESCNPLTTCIQNLYTNTNGIATNQITYVFDLSSGGLPGGVTTITNILPANLPLAINSGYGVGFYSSHNANGIVYNDIANAILNQNPSPHPANSIVTGISSTSNVFSWKPVANLYVGNSFFINLTVLDGATLPAVANSIHYHIGYNSAFTTTPALSLSSNTESTQNSGNYILLTASGLVGGTTPYSYNFIISNVQTGVSLYNQLIINSITSNAYFFQIPVSAVGNQIQFNVVVTDSATTNIVVNSIYSYQYYTTTSSSCISIT